MQSKRNFQKILLLLIFTIPFCFDAAAELTAAEAVNKGANTLFHSKGLKTDFTCSIAGKSGNGTLISKGKKFVFESPFVNIWYNGVAMYTYNPRTKETTVTHPTASELAESNPLSYIHANKAYYAKDVSRKGDRRVISLHPYDDKMGVKEIILTLDESTCIPKIIKLILNNGQSSTITIKNLQLDAYPGAKTFEYPANRYPGVPVVDLR